MNRVFKTTLSSKGEHFKKIDFKKESNVLTVNFNKQDSFLPTDLNDSSSLIDDMRFEPSASKPEDIYYDEIIYYDGGGVDGYGD